jgi:hypothetical protein
LISCLVKLLPLTWFDQSSWIGHPFEYDGKEFDLVVRFCKDVETRGQAGYVDFGRFDPLSYFVSSSENFDFVQVRAFTSLLCSLGSGIRTNCCIW